MDSFGATDPPGQCRGSDLQIRAVHLGPVIISRLLAVFAARNDACEIILVNDASPDKTWEKLLELNAAHPDTVRIVRC